MRGRSRADGSVLERVNDSPFRTAAGVATVLATLVTLYRTVEIVEPGEPAAETTVVAIREVSLSALVEFALTSPVYPVTIVVGLALLVLLR